MKGKISTRQAGIIASLMLFCNKLLVLPSLLFELSKADGLFVIVLLLAFELGLLAMFLKLKRDFPNSSFYEIIQQKMGIVVAKIFYSLLVIYFFYKIMLIFNISYMYFHIQVYVDASYYIFIFVFLLAMNTSVLRGLRPLARGCEFFYILIITSLVFCLMLSIANYDHFPLFLDSPPANFGVATFKHLFCFGDMLVLFAIMEKIEVDKGFNKKMLGFFGISGAIIATLYFMFYSAFGLTSFMYKNAISDIITFSYRFIDIGRLDIISITTVMFMTILQLSLYSYALTSCFQKIFTSLSRIYCTVVFDIIFIAVVVSSAVNYLVAIELGKSIMVYLALIVQILFPLLLLAFRPRKKEGS